VAVCEVIFHVLTVDPVIFNIELVDEEAHFTSEWSVITTVGFVTGCPIGKGKGVPVSIEVEVTVASFSGHRLGFHANTMVISRNPTNAKCAITTRASNVELVITSVEYSKETV